MTKQRTKQTTSKYVNRSRNSLLLAAPQRFPFARMTAPVTQGVPTPRTNVVPRMTAPVTQGVPISRPLVAQRIARMTAPVTQGVPIPRPLVAQRIARMTAPITPGVLIPRRILVAQRIARITAPVAQGVPKRRRAQRRRRQRIRSNTASNISQINQRSQILQRRQAESDLRISVPILSTLPQRISLMRAPPNIQQLLKQHNRHNKLHYTSIGSQVNHITRSY